MWEGFGIGMSDIKTVAKLRQYVDELTDLFEHFILDGLDSNGSVKQYDAIVTKNEVGKLGYKSYDYESIYKKIDDVVDKIKCIDTKERI